ncbi:hypothetical protein [Vibrio phage vB_pir03]|nr:hypothetical protein [Vibrio phage vB_pir03]
MTTKGPTSFSDLSELELELNDREYGQEIAYAHLGKFIGNRGLVIASHRHQFITEDFWRGYLSVKQERLKELSALYLTDLNEESALSLAKVMHDLNIKPRKVYFDGVDVNA